MILAGELPFMGILEYDKALPPPGVLEAEGVGRSLGTENLARSGRGVLVVRAFGENSAC